MNNNDKCKLAIEIVRDLLLTLGLKESLLIFDVETGISSSPSLSSSLSSLSEKRKDMLSKMMIHDKVDVDKPILVDVISKVMTNPTTLSSSKPSPPKHLHINTSLDTLSSSHEDIPSPLKNRSKSSSPKSSSPTPLSPLNIEVASTLSSAASKNSPSPTNMRSNINNGTDQRSPPSTIPRYTGAIDVNNLPSLPANTLRRSLEPLPQLKDKSIHNIKSPGSDVDLDASGELSDAHSQEFESSAKSFVSLENSNRSLGSLKDLEYSNRSINSSFKDPLENSIASDRSLGSLKNLKEIDGLKPLGAIGKSKLAPIESNNIHKINEASPQPLETNMTSEKVILEESKPEALQTALNPITRSRQMKIVSKNDDDDGGENNDNGVSVKKSGSGSITRSTRGWENTENNDNDVFNEDDDKLKPKTSPITKHDWNEESVDSSFQSDEVLDQSPKTKLENNSSPPIVRREFAVEKKDTKQAIVTNDDDDYGDEDFEEEIEEIEEEIDEDDDISTGNKSEDSNNPFGFKDEPPKKLFEKKEDGQSLSRQKSGILEKITNLKKPSVEKADMEDFDESVASNDSDNFEFSVGASENSASRDGSFSFLNDSGAKDTKKINKKNSPRNSLQESGEFEYSVTEQELSNSEVSDFDYTTTNLGPRKK